MSSPIDNQCLIGTVVDSNYWLHDILGAGSYGVVYKALDLRTSRDPVPTYWAIKVLQKAGRQPFELENIRREISLHMAMTLYPGIVTMYDVVDEDDRTFIILDLCDTGDLLEHIAVRGTYKDNEELLRMAFISLVDAVTACHMNNIAHRDLKPENILVNQDGSELFLTDFGLATTRSTISEFDASTGVYMSPESIGDLTSHVPFNPRTADIWSLGIILVNMLTGRYPWTKADRSDPAFAAYLADADYLSKWAPLSPAAVTLLRRMLNPDPLSRINLTALRRAVHALNTFSAPLHAWHTDFCGVGCDEAARRVVRDRRATPFMPRVLEVDEEDHTAEWASEQAPKKLDKRFAAVDAPHTPLHVAAIGRPNEGEVDTPRPAAADWTKRAHLIVGLPRHTAASESGSSESDSESESESGSSESDSESESEAGSSTSQEKKLDCTAHSVVSWTTGSYSSSDDDSSSLDSLSSWDSVDAEEMSMDSGKFPAGKGAVRFDVVEADLRPSSTSRLMMYLQQRTHGAHL